MECYAAGEGSSSVTYANDFFSRAYLPWLELHPDHLASAVHLAEGLKQGLDLRERMMHRHAVPIPETLVVSLTERCNLNCVFCARGGGNKNQPKSLAPDLLTLAMTQCRELGIRRIALVGGEPLLYPETVRLVEDYPDFFFTIFSNGRLLDESLLSSLAPLANHALIINASATHDRGIISCLTEQVLDTFERLVNHGFFFGFSATIHQHNRMLFARKSTLDTLWNRGAFFGVLFDYLADFGDRNDPLLLHPRQRRAVVEQAKSIAKSRSRLLICAPEDEHIMGGCSAAGRLTIHLQADGRLTPCPLVPYSGFDFPTQSLLQALKSNYFRELRNASQNWEKLPGSCAFRSGYREFDRINQRYGACRTEA